VSAFLFWEDIDYYIGRRYNYIGVRYIGIRIIGNGADSMANQTAALTEAVYYILLSLITPLHGYGIMQNIEVLSSGRVRLAAGTLYGAINTMLEKGWIRALPGERDSRKKEYLITDMGMDVLNCEIVRLNELLSNGNRILGGLM